MHLQQRSAAQSWPIHIRCYHDISWCFMIFHDISWYFMELHNLHKRTMPMIWGVNQWTFHHSARSSHGLVVRKHERRPQKFMRCRRHDDREEGHTKLRQSAVRFFVVSTLGFEALVRSNTRSARSPLNLKTRRIWRKKEQLIATRIRGKSRRRPWLLLWPWSLFTTFYNHVSLSFAMFLSCPFLRLRIESWRVQIRALSNFLRGFTGRPRTKRSI